MYIKRTPMAQLAVLLLASPEIRGSNPIIGKKITTLVAAMGLQMLRKLPFRDQYYKTDFAVIELP